MIPTETATAPRRPDASRSSDEDTLSAPDQTSPVPGPGRSKHSIAAGWRTDVKDLTPTLVVVGIAVLASVLVVIGFLATSSSGPAGDISVSLTNFRIVMPTTMRAGHHTFALVNNGTADHELVVFRTDVPANALPLRPDGDVNEDSALLHSVADSGNPLKAGQGRSVPGTFSPGHYVAVCNLPAHYRLGMRLDIIVSP